MTSLGGATVMLNWAVTGVSPPSSLSWTVKVKTPRCVGDPARLPVPELSEMPGGKPPAVMFQEYGGMPPVPVNDAEYGLPTVAGGGGGLVMFNGGAPIAMPRLASARAPRLSVTWTVKPELPALVGVPESWPVDGLSEMPGGSAPPASSQLYGGVPPVAARV